MKLSDTWNSVACPGCGCVCDDISLQITNNRLTGFRPACPLGQQWFESRIESKPLAPMIEGKNVSLDAAIDRASQILRNANYPLIYGLSRSATPGQRAAVALGEAIGGVVDTTASLCHGPSIMALQEFGEVTCTLGEVRNRADLVIFWGCDPANSHPRHAERYSVHAKSRWLPDGRSSRKVVMIGNEDQVGNWRIDGEGTTADLTIGLPNDQDFEMLAILRAMLNGREVEAAPPEWKQLVSMMKQCNYGVVFFGLGLAGTSGWGMTNPTNAGRANVSALLQLVAELNAFSRFTARRMRLQGDVSGADNVLCWQTGYPFAVDFSRGYPRYNPGEFTANELLQRGDTDACLMIGAETVRYFSDGAIAHLNSIPTILLDYPGAESDLSADVHITTAVYGLHATGTIYRMDNVPLEATAMLNSDLPTDQYVLETLLEQYRD